MKEKMIEIVNGALKDQFDYVPLVKAINVAEDLLTNDVQPVTHGKWVDDIFGQGDMICSECEQYPATDEDGNPLSALACWQPEYCPNCGAKMDLE